MGYINKVIHKIMDSALKFLRINYLGQISELDLSKISQIGFA